MAAVPSISASSLIMGLGKNKRLFRRANCNAILVRANFDNYKVAL